MTRARILADLGGVTSSATELNVLDGITADVTDLNYAKTLYDTGVTAAEFDYLDGVTSNIQTQLSGAGGMTLLHSVYTSLTSGDTHKIAPAARGVGTGASGSGYLFQTDYYYYKVYWSGIAFDGATFPAMIGIDTSDGDLTASTYNYSIYGLKTNGVLANENNTTANKLLFTGIDSHSTIGKASTQSPYGNSNCEMTFFNPAGTGYTGWNFTHTHVVDSDQNVRSQFGTGVYTTAGAWGGFEFISGGGGGMTFDGRLNCTVYGLKSDAIV